MAHNDRQPLIDALYRYYAEKHLKYSFKTASASFSLHVAISYSERWFLSSGLCFIFDW